MTTAVLFIDVQRAIVAGLANGERQLAIDALLDEVAARLGRLKRDAEMRGVPVVMVQHDGDADHRLAVETPGWQFREEVTPRHDSIIIHKRSCDAFYDTELNQTLTELGVQHLLIGGCMTQFCVDTTVRRAVSLGYSVTLLQDGHTTADFGNLTAEQIVDHHNCLLSGFDAGSSSVDVVPTAAVRFH
jgi:nicotinamidase-related amidase